MEILRRVGFAALGLLGLFLVSRVLFRIIDGYVLGRLFAPSASWFTGAIEYLLVALLAGLVGVVVMWRFPSLDQAVSDALMVAIGLSALLTIARVAAPEAMSASFLGPNDVVSNQVGLLDIEWVGDLANAVGFSLALVGAIIVDRRRADEESDSEDA